MSARFILSFDCEGRWGVADKPAPYRAQLTDDRLRFAYSSVLKALADFEMHATFAFVGCFMLPRRELLRLPLNSMANEIPYLIGAVDEIAEGAQGWTGDWAVDMASKSHEIALHGVTHTPWTDMTEQQARREMSLVPLPARTTFVYPRNKLSHRSVLEEFRVVGYRAARPCRSRLRSFLSEWNVLQQPDVDPPPSRLIEIPAGFFINWQSGLRRLVPTGVSRVRIRNLLSAAAAVKGVVHFWSHPENFATAPGTFVLLRALLEEVVRFRDKGKLLVQTQIQYCDAFQSSMRSAA